LDGSQEQQEARRREEEAAEAQEKFDSDFGVKDEDQPGYQAPPDKERCPCGGGDHDPPVRHPAGFLGFPRRWWGRVRAGGSGWWLRSHATCIATCISGYQLDAHTSTPGPSHHEGVSGRVHAQPGYPPRGVPPAPVRQRGLRDGLCRGGHAAVVRGLLPAAARGARGGPRPRLADACAVRGVREAAAGLPGGHHAPREQRPRGRHAAGGDAGHLQVRHLPEAHAAGHREPRRRGTRGGVAAYRARSSYLWPTPPRPQTERTERGANPRRAL
jgi:hypothetical protein